MIFNFKSKPQLSEIIPKGYVDIHSHLLPGIDDGAKTIEESYELLKSVSKLGFSKVITTPHTITHVWDNGNSSILGAKEILYQHHGDLCTELKLQAASEYLIDDQFISRIPEGLLCLKDKEVLVELSYLDAPSGLHQIIFDLRASGYQPILAHPERYRRRFRPS